MFSYVNGWGGRIRTHGPGTKTRCLTTWPHPTNFQKGSSALDRKDQTFILGQLAPFYTQRKHTHKPPKMQEGNHTSLNFL